MTRRLQCGGAFLEIDPLTGELTFDDFLNALPPPEMEPMQTPKVELGPSFGVFGIPVIDNLFADIFAQLDLVTQDIDKFIAYLKKKTKDAINWGLVLAGVTTVSQVIPIVISQISGLVFRWQAFHRWEEEQKEENQPRPITDEELERKEEISELSGEDQEPPSLGEVEEPLLDEGGEQVFNPDGTPATVTRVFALPRDISDDYEPIPEPPDLSEQEPTPEPDEPLEEDLIEVNDKLIQDLIQEFDPQNVQNDENIEYLLDSGVYIIHIKHLFLKRECIMGGAQSAKDCAMITDYVAPAFYQRYSRKFSVRVPNCSTYPRRCCACHGSMGQDVVGHSWRVRVIPKGQPLWTNCECTCGENCQCPCHIPGPGAVRVVRHTCNRWKLGTAANALLGKLYFSDCWNYPSISTGEGNTPFQPGDMVPPAYKIIRTEAETKDFPSNSRECCEFCKVMYRYYTTTRKFKLHRTMTEAYIFFSRGQDSTIFERCKEILTGPATNRTYDLLSDWDGGSNQILERRAIDCKCSVKRPRCTATFRGAGESHADTEAYFQGHAQKLKFIYQPDFDDTLGEPWWYNDPHDYQSVKKICVFEGYLEQGIPEHVVRFSTYRRLADKDWFPALYKKIRDLVMKKLLDLDLPPGFELVEDDPLNKKKKEYFAWLEIDRMLSDVIPIAEIYPELSAPERPLFASRPEGWAGLKAHGSVWPADVAEELQPVRTYLALLDKYYPGWWAFREKNEPDWWDGFWAQIPDLEGVARTSIFLFEDLSVFPPAFSIKGEPSWWRGFWGPTIRDNIPSPDRPRSYKEVAAVCDRY